jgi:hypothetical protein
MQGMSLPERMRALADSGHPRAAELREKAAEMEAVDFNEKDAARRILAAWARARRLWCACTGEPLI